MEAAATRCFTWWAAHGLRSLARGFAAAGIDCFVAGVLPAAKITRFCRFSRTHDAVFIVFSETNTAPAQRTPETVVI